jgi:GDPmannose 4,6-dehydratase
MIKKIIVTGATGQDGSYMIEYLLNNTEHKIVAAVRRTSQFINSNLKNVIDNSRVSVVYFDLIDPHSIETLIKNEQPDYFINFGAQTFVADSWNMPFLHFQTNAISTLHILEAIRKHCPQCKLYLSGSSEEVGDVDYSPQDEKHPLKPRSPYAASKATGRLLAKVYRESYNIFVVQGILFNHESERRQDYFVTRKITKGVARIYHAIKNNQPFAPIELGNIDARRDWSHAEDFVDGVWKMINSSKPKDYVLSSNETHTIREFINKSFVCAGIEGIWHGSGQEEQMSVSTEYAIKNEIQSSILVKINPKFYRPAEVELLLGDSTLARQELGWNPKISFDNLVERMVKYDIDNFKI